MGGSASGDGRAPLGCGGALLVSVAVVAVGVALAEVAAAAAAAWLIVAVVAGAWWGESRRRRQARAREAARRAQQAERRAHREARRRERAERRALRRRRAAEPVDAATPLPGRWGRAVRAARAAGDDVRRSLAELDAPQARAGLERTAAVLDEVVADADRLARRGAELERRLYPPEPSLRRWWPWAQPPPSPPDTGVASPAWQEAHDDVEAAYGALVERVDAARLLAVVAAQTVLRGSLARPERLDEALTEMRERLVAETAARRDLDLVLGRLRDLAGEPDP